MQRFRLLTEDHVKSLLSMNELITAMESAVARFSAREVLQLGFPGFSPAWF